MEKEKGNEKEGYLKRRRAAEWLVCRFGTPPGRAVSRWGLFERMAFSLEIISRAGKRLSQLVMSVS